ncbi:hypothetical protein Pmani_011794 [Petrolisthes manimaculis]|uniref:Uncharacterized protein n=1 Tax=Petrolisthes manimaculis TaxID=1843537 RepID=A0AAE1PYP9_9EUCA|nr:hypothetical protein Pmani_011794 [Petrolisthes manimaculis]
MLAFYCQLCLRARLANMTAIKTPADDPLSADDRGALIHIHTPHSPSPGPQVWFNMEREHLLIGSRPGITRRGPHHDTSLREAVSVTLIRLMSATQPLPNHYPTTTQPLPNHYPTATQPRPYLNPTTTLPLPYRVLTTT